MAIELLLSTSDPVAKTILGGNVDIDKYIFLIEDVQVKVIEPLLGTELYDKILTDKAASNLTGDYLTLFNKFIVPIIRYEFISEYMTITGIEVANAGFLKKQPDNYIVPDNDEILQKAQYHSQKAQDYVLRFNKWIGLNPLDEYKTVQDEVDADGNIQLIGGWWFSDD